MCVIDVSQMPLKSINLRRQIGRMFSHFVIVESYLLPSKTSIILTIIIIITILDYHHHDNVIIITITTIVISMIMIQNIQKLHKYKKTKKQCHSQKNINNERTIKQGRVTRVSRTVYSVSGPAHCRAPHIWPSSFFFQVWFCLARIYKLSL